MIDLLTYPPMNQQFSASPFCTKAACLLALSGQPWRREEMLAPRKMPYGKLPVIRAEGRIIPDSDGIKAYLEEKGTNFDQGLSKLDKATSRAFIRMAEDHMYFHLLLDRWGTKRSGLPSATPISRLFRRWYAVSSPVEFAKS